MATMLKVRPTKIELVKMQRRLALSQRVQKILKDRLALLTTQFIETARRAIAARRRMAEAIARAVEAAALAAGFQGAIVLERALLASESRVRVDTSTSNVAGARLPVLELPMTKVALPAYDLLPTSSLVDDAANAGREALPAIVALGQLERALEVLGAEIQRTKRISNALEYVVLPSLEQTIHALGMKFEERDREEKARLKHIKVLREHTRSSGTGGQALPGDDR
jgi:V/A-type H+/Na+-transporting ATPase subunit D